MSFKNCLKNSKKKPTSAETGELCSVFSKIICKTLFCTARPALGRIKTRVVSDSRIELQIQDNGLGFKGRLEKLGSEILMSQDARSNGIGLLITTPLLEKMGGAIYFEMQG